MKASEIWRSPHTAFLVLAIPFGLAYAVLTPPGQFADEAANFRRAYHLSTGQLLGEKWQHERGAWLAGDELPRSLTHLSHATRHLPHDPDAKITRDEIAALFDDELEREDVIPVVFWQTALYSPIPYLPQTLGVVIGKLFDAPPVALQYLARFFGLAFCILVNFLAIRITPLVPWAFFAFSLFPLCLFHMAGPGSDGVTGALSRFWLALALRAAAGLPGRGARLWVLGAVAALSALCKQAYFVLAGILFLLTPERFGGWRPYLKRVGGVFVASLMPWAIWSMLAVRIAVPPVTRPMVNPEEQVAWVASHPLAFVALMAKWAVFRMPGILVDSVNNLGWLDVPLPGWTLAASITALLAAMCCDRSRSMPILAWQRGVAAAVFTLSVGATLFTLYLWWTAPGNGTLHGFNGRYLFPVIPLLFVVGANPPVPKGWVQGFRRLAWALPVVALVTNATGVARLLDRYYG